MTDTTTTTTDPTAQQTSLRPPPDPSSSPKDLSTSPPRDTSRRSSFGFLRRQKSTDGPVRNMLTRKNKGHHHQFPPPQSVPRVPPQLPQPTNISTMDSLISPDQREQYGTAVDYGPAPAVQNPASSSYGVPVPPVPTEDNEFVDPYARTESMTHRGRYSYASSAISISGINSPRRVRRRKDPTPFNILVIGAQNSGKTSFIEFLRSSLLSSKNNRREKTPSPPQSGISMDSPFTPHYLETEVDHERIGVTIWDSQGFERKFVDLQLREMSAFLESKFEETFTEEQKVIRAPGVRDTHIHCVFLILDPSRLDANLSHSKRQAQSSSARFDEPHRLMGVLDEDLDLQVLKALQGKTTVIPVISKADTIATNHMAMLKQAVWNSLKQAKLDPLEAFTHDNDTVSEESFDERDEDALIGEDSMSRSSSIDLEAMLENLDNDLKPSASAGKNGHRRTPSALGTRLSNAENNTGDVSTPYLPMSIISPDTYEPGVVGRRFPWGFADPYNPDHCDFVRLKDNVFSEWRADLREASREIWYEGWRTSRLNRRVGTSHGPVVGAGVNSKIGSSQYHSQKASTATSIASNKTSPLNSHPHNNSHYNGGPRHRNASGNAITKQFSNNPGGPVGQAAPLNSSHGYTNGNAAGQRLKVQTTPAARGVAPGQAVPLSGPGSPEMVSGVFRQGVNAF